ncbi:MAG TPA: folylpolyglutamate synthase/dihydrofolate synthase family protein [Mycobacteriales bacterium]|nr:folylpolyglutamate synthase/dihydrofolate synthase family protein [Mycobacteriales bacterium]
MTDIGGTDPDQDRAELARVEKALSTRWPESRMDPTLDRIRILVDLLGNPQRAYPVVHLTGTNGKTSTARMVDSLLRSFGLRVGRTTSPHLESYTERISIDGQPVSGTRFGELYDDVAPYLELVDAQQRNPLSLFEVMTAMSFVAFADAPVDVAVIEVGLGGSWDSTNIADGQVAIITPIAIDHTRYLGNTVEEIATEKAGIIKPGAAAIFAAQQESAAEVLLHKVAEVGATAAREGLEFGIVERRPAIGGQLISLQGLSGRYDDIFLPLYGVHQAQNAACALAAVEAFFGAPERRAGETAERLGSAADGTAEESGNGVGGAAEGSAVGTEGPQPLNVDLVRAGFAEVTSPGRLEIVRTLPTVLLDAGHNPHGMAATIDAVSESFAFTRLVGVVAALSDKDVRGMLEVLEPALESIVVTENSSHRRLPVDELAALAVQVFGAARVTVEPRLDDAIDTGIQLAEEDIEGLGSSGVLITGSVITAGDARMLLGTGPA